LNHQSKTLRDFIIENVGLEKRHVNDCCVDKDGNYTLHLCDGRIWKGTIELNFRKSRLINLVIDCCSLNMIKISCSMYSNLEKGK
jgi:hypothetical protein